MVCGLRESLVDYGRDLSGYERFKFNFFVSFLPFARGKELKKDK